MPLYLGDVCMNALKFPAWSSSMPQPASADS